MSQKVILYRILIASPSDCIEERKIFPEMIISWNAANSFLKSAILEPVLWETHANPEFGDRPQELLNKQIVKNCDILVGAFWTRLGTNTGKAASGTVEEIEEFRNSGKPVLLYFSSLPVVASSIDSEQFHSLLEYKKKLEGEGIIFNYDSIDSLKTLFNRHLTSEMAKLHKYNSVNFDFDEENKKNNSLLSLEAYRNDFASFVRSFKNQWELEKDTYSQTYDLSESEYILDNSLPTLLQYLSQIISVEGLDTTAKINQCLRDIKLLRNNTKRLQSGFNHEKYYEEGIRITSSLETILADLDFALNEMKNNV